MDSSYPGAFLLLLGILVTQYRINTAASLTYRWAEVVNSLLAQVALTLATLFERTAET
jgi:hypothetical protein